MIAAFHKQGELWILYLQFKKSRSSNKNFAIASSIKRKKSYVIWICGQILDLLSLHSTGDGTIPQTSEDEMDNVRTSLSCVFQFVKVWPLMCHYKGHLQFPFPYLLRILISHIAPQLYFIKPKTHLNARKLCKGISFTTDYIGDWVIQPLLMLMGVHE